MLLILMKQTFVDAVLAEFGTVDILISITPELLKITC
jgi:hypothetical protein